MNCLPFISFYWPLFILINPYDREQNTERVVHIYGHVHGSGQGHVTLGLGSSRHLAWSNWVTRERTHGQLNGWLKSRVSWVVGSTGWSRQVIRSRVQIGLAFISIIITLIKKKHKLITQTTKFKSKLKKNYCFDCENYILIL